MSTSPELTKGNDLDNIFTARTTIEIDGVLYTLSNATITMPDGIDLTRSTYTQNDSTGYWINEDALEVYDATTTGYVEQGGSGPGIVDAITYKGASYKISLSADTSWILQLSLDAFSDLDAAIVSESFGVRAYTTVSPGIPIFRISTEDKKLYNNENRILTVADHITADMIPDGSITSDKLDWTTLDWSSILPYTSVSQKLPYASTNSATIYRIGNLCFFECSSRFTFSNVPGGGGDADETIPSGFRPKFAVHMNIASPMQAASMMLTFNTNGSIVFWTGYSVNNLLLAGTAAWWTDDPWPSN